MKESEIQKSIIDYLRKRKVFYHKVNTVGIYKRSTDSYIPSPSRGAPDIICIIKGRYVGLEVKTPKGKLSDDQIAFHRNLMAADGIVFTVRSLDEAIEAVEDTMKRLPSP